MEIYKLTPLTSLVWFQEGPGVRNTQYTNSGVKLLNVANLIDGHIDLSTSNRYIAEEEAYGRYRHFLCDKGDLVIASSGIKVDYFDKKMGFVRQEHLPLCMNTSTIRFKVLDKNILNIRYFMYFLKSNFFKSQLSKQITGSAQLNFGPSHLKRMIVPLINIDYQNHICGILDKVYELEYKLQTELTLLNQLVKSRFIEMFGDSQSNPKGFPYKRINEFAKCIAGATPSTKRKEYWSNGIIPWMSSGEVNYKRIWETEKRISQVGYDSCSTKMIPAHTVVIAMAGQGRTRGTVAVAEIPLCTNQSLCSIITDGTVDTDYLFTYLQFQYNNLRNISNGSSGRGGLNIKLIGQFAVLVPPLAIQQKFSNFLKEIDKSKLAVQKSLDELETLKKSLMQIYFG